MSNRFAGGLSKLRDVGGKAPVAAAEPPAAIETAAATETGPRYEQANRRGKVVISAYFDPAVRKQLAMLAIEDDRTQAALMAEALNLLFEKYGRSPIARA